MGINDEYSRDAYLGDHYAYNSDSDGEEFDSQIDPEDWQAIYSEDLLNGWMTIRAWLDDNYIQSKATYHSFIQFVLDPAPWCTTRLPGPTCLRLWNEISKIEIIRERITLEQFTGWFFSVCLQ